jgi:hypothetical protein
MPRLVDSPQKVRVVSSGRSGRITIGLSPKGYDNSLQPGCEPMSFGYNGKTGSIHGFDNVEGEDYGPLFTTGDCIGCGYNYPKQHLFFTKNGEDLGVAFRNIDVSVPLYPTIALHSPNEEVRVIVGSEAWLFQLGPLLENEEKAVLCKKKTMLLSPEVMPRIVENYLLQHGYSETYRAFCGEKNKRKRAGGNTDKGEDEAMSECSDGEVAAVPLDGCVSTLEFRGRMRGLICMGDIGRAITLLRNEDRWRVLLEERPEALFLLNCQRFVEMIRQKDFVLAISFARSELVQSARAHKSFEDVDMNAGNYSLDAANRCLRAAKWTNKDATAFADGWTGNLILKCSLPELMSYKLQEIVGLLAFPDTLTSPLSYLLRDQHKEVVADLINSCVLGSETQHSFSLKRTMCEWKATDFFSRKYGVFVPDSLLPCRTSIQPSPAAPKH